jgi:hypothetical protein
MAFAVLSSNAFAAEVGRNVALQQGVSRKAITLPAVSSTTVYRVTVTSPKGINVTADLRGKNGSITYPGIFTSISGKTRLRIYTYRPLEAGRYSVVLAKGSGPAVTVKVKVTSKAAQPAKPVKKSK